jgi:hypothetical protein
MGAYTEIKSFDIEELVAAGVTESRVVLAIGDKQVRVVHPERSNDIQLDVPIKDVAVGRQVYVLSDSKLLGKTENNDFVWEYDLEEDGCAVAADLNHSVVSVVTEEEMIGLDEETGEENFRIPRPHQDAVAAADTDLLVAGNGLVLHAAWSFITAISASGDRLFDVNLNSRINDFGVSEGCVVVSLQGDKIVGLDPKSGAQFWEIDQRSGQVSPAGPDRLPLIMHTAVGTIDTTGSVVEFSDIRGEAVFGTANGRILCVFGDGRVTVYSQKAIDGPTGQFNATIETTQLQEDDDLQIRVENTGSTSATATIGVTAEDVTFDTDTKEATVEAGATTAVGFRVSNISSSDEQVVDVTRDGKPVLSSTLPVVVRPEVNGRLELDRIEHGTAHLDLIVENEGESSIGPLGIVDREEPDLPRLSPGDSLTRNFEVEFELGQRIDIELRDDGWDTSVGVSLPTDPLTMAFQATVDSGGTFQDVLIANETAVPIIDRVSVDFPDGQSVVRAFEFTPEERVWIVVPSTKSLDQLENHTVETTVVGLELTRTKLVEKDANLIQSDEGTDKPHGTGTLNTDGLSSGEPSSSHLSSSDQDDWETNRTDGQKGDRDSSKLGTDSADREGIEEVGSNNVSIEEKQTNETISGIVLDRDVSHSPELGSVFEERIRVEVGSTVEELTITNGDSSIDVGRVEKGHVVVLSRQHVSFAENVELAEVCASANSGSVKETLEPQVIDVQKSPIVVRGRIISEEERATIQLEIENTADVMDQSCRIERLSLNDGGEWVVRDDVFPLSPGDDAEISQTLTSDRLSFLETTDVVPATVTVQFERDEPMQLQTLFAVESPSATEWPLSVNIDPETKVMTDYGNVVLNVKNDANRSIEDISVEARGEVVNELMYAPDDRDIIEENETLVHRIDVKPSGADNVELRADLSIGNQTRTLVVTGPTVEEEEWSEDHHSEWTADWKTGDVEREHQEEDTGLLSTNPRYRIIVP